jgi:hypothetical protein
MWIRLDVVRMFIEHTCPPGQSTHPTNANNAFLLWTVKPNSIFHSKRIVTKRIYSALLVLETLE